MRGGARWDALGSIEGMRAADAGVGAVPWGERSPARPEWLESL